MAFTHAVAGRVVTNFGNITLRSTGPGRGIAHVHNNVEGKTVVVSDRDIHIALNTILSIADAVALRAVDTDEKINDTTLANKPKK